MVEIIGVRFKEVGKIYYFDPDGIKVKQGDHVIVETARGIECSEVVLPNREVDDNKVVSPLRKALRLATPEDLAALTANEQKAKEAFAVCEKKIAQHKLDMKLIDVEYTFDGSKILFYFTADGRVDFRELVKDLAGVFRMRIELRQIGVRDEAKMYGGLGMCGRPLCCASFLDDFQPVSIKMAKEQGLSLNPTKISGTCGRLMCCLKYEQDAYEDLIRTTPKVDSHVCTPDGTGTVIEINLLRGLCKVRLDDSQDPPKFYPKADCVSSKGGCSGNCGKCSPGAEEVELPAVIKDAEPVESVLAAAEDAILPKETEECIAVEMPAEEIISAEETVGEEAEKEVVPAVREGGRPRHRGHRGRGGQRREGQNAEARENQPAERREKPAEADNAARSGGQKPRQEQKKNDGGNRPPRQDQPKKNDGANPGSRPPRPPKSVDGKPPVKHEKPAETAEKPVRTAPVEGNELPKDGEAAKKRPHHRGHRGHRGKGGNRPPREGGAPGGDAPKAE